MGGVENLFSGFIQATPQLSHNLICTGKYPHPAFQEALHYCKTTCIEKSPLRRFIPKALRKYQRTSYLAKLHNPQLLFWNRIEETQVPYSAIYYEHGAAWMGSVTGQKQLFLESCDHHLAVSYAAKRMLQLRWGLKKDITIIPNPLRPDIPIKTAPKALSITDPIRLGFIGRLVPLKGVSLLFHALQLVQKAGVKATLCIAGEGPEKRSLQALAARLHLDSTISFKGHIQSITEWYDSIDILLVPSIREPLGLIALESQARGVPVIAAAVDGLFEVTQQGIQIEPSLPISAYTNLGGTLKNIPEVVYNPCKDALTHPLLLDPQTIANAILTLQENYNCYSNNALLANKKNNTFIKYVHQLTEFISSL